MNGAARSAILAYRSWLAALDRAAKLETYLRQQVARLSAEDLAAYTAERRVIEDQRAGLPPRPPLHAV